LRYLEQLSELYWWRYSGLIIVTAIVFTICLAIVGVQIAINWDKLRLMKMLRGD